jgi:hypothetical protein
MNSRAQSSLGANLRAVIVALRMLEPIGHVVPAPKIRVK